MGLKQVKCKALTAILSPCNDNKFVAFCRMCHMAKVGLLLVPIPQHVDAVVAEAQAEQAQTCLLSQRSLGSSRHLIVLRDAVHATHACARTHRGREADVDVRPVHQVLVLTFENKEVVPCEVTEASDQLALTTSTLKLVIGIACACLRLVVWACLTS